MSESIYSIRSIAPVHAHSCKGNAVKNRVLYLMSGAAHMPYLVCSLYTLRQWWDGEIEVAAWPESYPFAEQVCNDSRLGDIILTARTPEYKGKNDQFIDKIALAQERPDCDLVMYLDADTTVHGKIDQLFEAGACHGFAATQFNEWTTAGRVIQRRIRRLTQFSELDQHYVDSVLANPWPSVNGGVWVASPTSPVLPEWYRWTMAAKSIFIADETCLHPLMVKFLTEHKMLVVQDQGRWNCSPKHRSPNLEHGDVVISHYHGDSNVRLNKSMAGVNRWWPIYQECLQKNIGGIRDWRKDVDNKYLKQAELELS